MDISGDTTAPRIVAAIDIGSNSVRMVVAQVLGDGQIDILERMHRAVRLGQDTFLRSRLSQRTMIAAIAILRDYRRVLDSYHVSQVRAVATSAVREAVNSDAFLDRILMATHLDVEVIEPAEEGRLTVSAVLHAVGADDDLRRGSSLIIDVGGGGTLLTQLRDGQISASGSFALGSIRMQEMLATSQEPAERAADLYRHQIASALTMIKTSLPLSGVEHVIAVGGDARFAAARIGRRADAPQLTVIERKAFDRFVRKCAVHTPAELARTYGMSFAEAETLVPALLGYQALLHATKAGELRVSDVTMRDGLLLELTQTFKAEEAQTQISSVLQSARSLGEKYRYDADHARHVAELSLALFDVMQAEHRLSPRERLLLEVAATLHDIGAYVGSSSHHKHSYYLIANAELYGLRQTELQTVALVARYHRRSAPKRTHLEYISLPREGRMAVSKLAAILRVADALDRGHVQQVRNLRFELDPNELVVHIPGVPDLTLERRALVGKVDLFEDVYGLNVRLEEADAAPAEVSWPESEM